MHMDIWITFCKQIHFGIHMAIYNTKLPAGQNMSIACIP